MKLCEIHGCKHSDDSQSVSHHGGVTVVEADFCSAGNLHTDVRTRLACSPRSDFVPSEIYPSSSIEQQRTEIASTGNCRLQPQQR